MRRRGIAFLNSPGHGREAHVAWEVVAGGYGFFVISDCSRKVSLELSLDGADDTDGTLHKLDALIAAAVRARKAVVAVSK